MGSSRLPGKVLMPVAGKPLLGTFFTDWAQCHTVDKVAVATSTDQRDDAIETFCRAGGRTLHTGPAAECAGALPAGGD
jgi:spore coat polysaccharide biosynthesis protein SpsF